MLRKLLLLSAFLGLVDMANACTNFIVGKKASADGSVICTYNADDYGLFINLCHYPAGNHPKGTMRKIFNWDTNKYQGVIPKLLKPIMLLVILMSFRFLLQKQRMADEKKWKTQQVSLIMVLLSI